MMKLSSMKNNMMSNFIAQFYTTGITLVMIPVYLHYMGKEAYGLVGFYAVLIGWFTLLDLGFTPALGREVARYRGKAIGADELRSIERAMLALFSGIGIIVVLLAVLSSGIIAKHWLKVEDLSMSEVGIAITLMGVIFALKWPSGVFRSVIIGFEEQVLFNIVNIAMATIRAVGIIPLFIYLGATIRVFFVYQAVVAGVELLILGFLNYRIMPSFSKGYKRTWSLAPLKSIWRFAVQVGYLSFVWMLVTQTDKLLLSRFLTLSDYAYYAIAVAAAGGIVALNGPITQAVLPRLTRFAAENKKEELWDLYRKTTRMICLIAGSAAVVLVTFARPLLWAWTQDVDLAFQAARVLVLYSLGNIFLVVMGMQYNLQFAYGDLRLHVKGNVIFPVVLVPCIIWATMHYGMTGASFVWMLINLLFLLIWTPIVHRRFYPGHHMRWLMGDVMPIAVILAGMAVLMKQFPLDGYSRIGTILMLAAWYALTLVTVSLATREGRTNMAMMIKRAHHLGE